jgi:hypothetical protein
MGSIDWGYGITRPSIIFRRRMLIASKEEAGESDGKSRGCLGQKSTAQKSIAQSDSDRAAHKLTDRCVDTSETRALARNECSANESDTGDNLACAGVMRRVLSHERTKRVRIPP